MLAFLRRPAASIERRLGADIWLRTASALVLIPAALALVGMGGWLFRLAVFGACVMLFFEWGRLTRGRGRSKSLLSQTILLLSALLAQGVGQNAFAFALVVFGALFMLLTSVLPRQRNDWAALGLLYIGVPALSILFLRDGALGAIGVFLLFVIVWATDIGAYITGRVVGGPKLWPAVSPNKTWSGLAGGVASATLLAAAYAAIFNLSIWGAAAAGFILALVSQAGDFFESAIKRAFLAKDAGKIIPGHGGMLDRLDGLLFAAPVSVLILEGLVT